MVIVVVFRYLWWMFEPIDFSYERKYFGVGVLTQKARFAMSHPQKFYGVTMSGSVYLAEIYPGGQYPSLTKVFQANNKQSQWKIGEKESSGMLSIGRFLLLFIPEGGGRASPNVSFEREATRVNTFYWGPNTSDVVALFLEESDALACVQSKDLDRCDSRWKDKTIATLRAIGDSHPRCSISTSMSNFWLLPPSEWMP